MKNRRGERGRKEDREEDGRERMEKMNGRSSILSTHV